MKNNFILLCIGFLIAGCEEVIQLDLPTDSPRLVVEASLKMSPNESITQEIKLSLSGPFYQEENLIVSEATLELIDLSNNIVHEFEYDNTNLVYTLQYTPVFDTDYKIRIIYEEEIYESCR